MDPGVEPRFGVDYFRRRTVEGDELAKQALLVRRVTPTRQTARDTYVEQLIHLQQHELYYPSRARDLRLRELRLLRGVRQRAE